MSYLQSIFFLCITFLLSPLESNAAGTQVKKRAPKITFIANSDGDLTISDGIDISGEEHRSIVLAGGKTMILSKAVCDRWGEKGEQLWDAFNDLSDEIKERFLRPGGDPELQLAALQEVIYEQLVGAPLPSFLKKIMLASSALELEPMERYSCFKALYRRLRIAFAIAIQMGLTDAAGRIEKRRESCSNFMLSTDLPYKLGEVVTKSTHERGRVMHAFCGLEYLSKNGHEKLQAEAVKSINRILATREGSIEDCFEKKKAIDLLKLLVKSRYEKVKTTSREYLVSALIKSKNEDTSSFIALAGDLFALEDSELSNALEKALIDEIKGQRKSRGYLCVLPLADRGNDETLRRLMSEKMQIALIDVFRSNDYPCMRDTVVLFFISLAQRVDRTYLKSFINKTLTGAFLEAFCCNESITVMEHVSVFFMILADRIDTENLRELCSCCPLFIERLIESFSFVTPPLYQRFKRYVLTFFMYLAERKSLYIEKKVLMNSDVMLALGDTILVANEGLSEIAIHIFLRLSESGDTEVQEIFRNYFSLTKVLFEKALLLEKSRDVKMKTIFILQNILHSAAASAENCAYIQYDVLRIFLEQGLSNNDVKVRLATVETLLNPTRWGLTRFNETITNGLKKALDDGHAEVVMSMESIVKEYRV